MILVSIVNVWFIIPTAMMSVVLYGFHHVYVSASREIKKTESVLRSQIFDHNNATRQGLSTISTISAFNAQDSVIKHSNSRIDIYSSACPFMLLSITLCFAFWLDIIFVVHIAVITYTFVEMDSSGISDGNVGSAITKVISLVGVIQWSIRQTSVKLVAPRKWPSNGIVEFKDFLLYFNVKSLLKYIDIEDLSQGRYVHQLRWWIRKSPFWCQYQ